MIPYWNCVGNVPRETISNGETMFNPDLFSGSIRLSNGDSTIEQDKQQLDLLAKLNTNFIGNSYYCYIYGSLMLLINMPDTDLIEFKKLFNDGGKGIKPLSLDNSPE